jgi:hypothetical protein
MRKNIIESSIYFTPREIFDALMSSKKTMTTAILIELARDRGLIVSHEDSREDIIKYLSTFVYDYYDLNVLIEHITPSHKKEKLKTTQLDTVIEVNDLIKASKDISNNQEDKTRVTTTKDIKEPNKTILKIEWEDIDLSKTRLRQKAPKESIVEFVEENGIMKVSKASNEKVDEVLQSIISKISKKKAIEIKEEKINLYGFSFEEKTEYFTKLINSVDNCTLSDVVKVSVNKEDSFDEEEEMINIITNASFKGVGLLGTGEYQKLKDAGYFITSIIWQSIENKNNGNKIEFEASLIISKECEELTFAPKVIFRSNGEKGYTKSRRPLKDDERIEYIKVLEEQAFSIYKGIIDKEE